MKNMKLTAALLAIASAAVISTTAQAATTYSTGDLILGIYDTTNTITKSYEVNLGSFTSLTNGKTWALGSDLSTLFGGSTTLTFAIVDATHLASFDGFGSRTLFLSTTGTIPTAISGQQTTIDTNINALISSTLASGSFTGQPANGATFANATEIANSLGNSFFTDQAKNGGSFGESTNGNILNSFQNGVASSTPSNLEVLPNGGTPITAGSFAFDSNGTLTFTAAVTVPEPSTYALLGLGAAMLVLFARRRSML